MKIGIVLPGCQRKPSGGSKVIYQYANYLAEDDKNHVVIYFDMTYSSLKKMKNVRILQKLIAYLLVFIRPKWFSMNPKIKKKAILSISEETIQTGDAIIATGIQTANPIALLSEKKGKKFYFIQGFENWDYDDEFVLQTYRLGMRNITVAKWLSNIVDSESGKSSLLVSNGIDIDIFNLKNPLESRPKHSIAMQYSSRKYKGCNYAFETIQILKKKYPDLKVTVFSSEPMPSNILEIDEYVYGASQEKVAEIDNNAEIFICSSVKEGFGLPGLEAMACGCVLAASEYEGVFEYAEDMVNAVLSPVKDSRMMAENIIKVFEDRDLRLRLSANAQKTASERSIQKSAKKFAAALCVDNN